MTAVVAASVLVAALTDGGSQGAWSEAVLEDGTPVAPNLVLVEAANVLRRLERTNELTRGEATAAHRDLLAIDIVLLPFSPFADRVWELRRTMTCYDAWYVAVAETSRLPLATLDRRLSRASGASCRFLLPR